MKRFFCHVLMVLMTVSGFTQEKSLPKDSLPQDSFYVLTPAIVRAVRAGENSPFTRTNLTKKEIAQLNTGVDIPFLLNQTPSVVANSDAGNGIGYTGIRIRGTDATRINVTLNGIPFNDAESQGTFFVNLPDFSSSATSIQIQRGVGTSSNGTGAFGASINFSTNDLKPTAYTEISNSVGSFGTRKHTLKYGSGLINGFSTDIRLSSIKSDGFIDRASSDLRSFYISTAYLRDSTSLRLNVFSGKEKTYQAWYGISQADLEAGNRTLNYAGTEKPGSPYDNETDNYQQTHYQLLLETPLKKNIQFNTALFLTRGKGYYEQYKADEPFTKYGLTAPAGNPNADFIRQLWLDNYFFGNNFSLELKNKKTIYTLGGSVTRYLGNHYGKIIWASEELPLPHTWYHHTANKKEQSLYFKQQTEFKPNWYIFYDLQYRQLQYDINGFRDNPNIILNNRFRFFNPKGGITYRKGAWRTYLSISRGSKEPNRDDFEAGTNQLPRPEKLANTEAGVEYSHPKYNWGATIYHMHYKDQLVLTGKINDVGAYTRTNVPTSYRMGIELQGVYKFSSSVELNGNLTLSSNRVKNLEEYLDDYDNGGQQKNTYANSTLAFSPAVVANASLVMKPIKGVDISLPLKYVSSQYLDNTANSSRMLEAFYVQDFKLSYTGQLKWIKEFSITGQLNNIFNTHYEPNGYTFSYIYGGQVVTENYFFPMAGRNFMLGLSLRW